MKNILSIFILLTTLVISGNSIAQTKIFEYTGKPQTYKIPSGVTSILVELTAAGGGFSSWENERFVDKYKPGKGGKLTATYPVTPGETIYVFVGGRGDNATNTREGDGGFNGGGNGNNTGEYGPYCGGGGGGASDIRIGGSGLANRVLIAGGGGGAGSNYPDGGDHGGQGGGLKGTDGQADNSTDHVSCGRGATQASGGKGGQWSSYLAGQNGKFGNGGDAPDSTAGGGGGGGYYGGGAGSWSGGGGGSSFSEPKASEIAHEQGINSKNGRITITPGKKCEEIKAIASRKLICEGESITLEVQGTDGVVWNNGVQEGVAFVPPVGTNTYKVTVEGVCAGKDEVIVVVNKVVISGQTIEKNPNHAGEILLNIEGGSAPYSYKWIKNERILSRSKDLIGIAGGEYIVEVKDSLGCVSTKSFTVNEVEPPEGILGPKLEAEISQDQSFVDVSYPGAFEFKIENMDEETVITGHAVDFKNVEITRLKPGTYRVSLIYKQIKQYVTFVKN